jgi:DNA-binding winged helix-turn-helix (wHTH) protein
MINTLAYVFPPFRLLPSRRELVCGDAPITLGGRAFDLLVSLVERRDRTVGKNELMNLVWPTVVVEENNLQVQMVALRKLLGHPAIATVPGRGYRFTLPVQVEGDTAPVIPGAGEPADAATCRCSCLS